MANPSKLNTHDRPDEYASESYLRRIKAEIRKTNKPIMEKKRRARINNYLNDLKGLLLDAMKKDPVRHSKLEKADILDLTVKHLQDIERRRLTVAMAVDPTVPEKFATGYRECIDEIGKYFDTLGSVDAGLKGRVRKHLEACLTFPAAGSKSGFPGPGPGSGFSFAGVPLPPSDDINNNTHGLLNRAFANNLSLMFPTAVPFSGESGSVPMPFHSFPFFNPLRAATLGHPSFTAGGGRPSGQDSGGERSPGGLSVPSPPASPNPSHEPTMTETLETLRTPVGKTGTTSISDHNMDRLLAIFPTPPSPEDPVGRSRLGKLGHQFDSSPFVPTTPHRPKPNDGDTEHGPELGDGDPVPDETMDSGREEDEDDGKLNQGEEGPDNPHGEMWRPW